ncbi:hypothetical protein ACFOLC_11175 [Lysobacter cavernae]|uniref:Glycosyltransferase n=1 Tax=Lysobacter cavernae TaxID=1685901 RepID=A0ABV7RUA6_9GAMM
MDLVDCGMPLPRGLHLWRLRTLSPLGQLRQMIGIALGNAVCLLRMMLSWRGRGTAVYVPYPAIFVLWMLSWLPRSIRPRCIADAYISMWDASFRDRSAGEGGIVARIVRAFEARALRAASVVLVDTVANKRHFVEDFEVDPARVHAFPLAIDEARFLAIPAATDDGGREVRVLFVGTLIPLHGVDKILAAAKELAGTHPRVRFRIIGDGQLGTMIERFIADHPRAKLEWIREWCDLGRIAEEIAQADICLGVFGGGGKAARVLPFKLYMYFAGGRPVISQEKLSVPDGAPLPPVIAVDPSVCGSIGDAIVRLIEQGAPARHEMGRQAREYYKAWLSNTEVLHRWESLQADRTS